MEPHSDRSTHPRVAVIGGGPAGLMAAEAAIARGVSVDLYEAKGSVGRKLLIAGRGGLNLTHAEPGEAFVRRYGAREREVGAWLHDFDANALRAWARELGVDTFVGSSGRVFPNDLKAAPLLRHWVHRLREAGVRFHVRHRWIGWNARGALRFEVEPRDTSTPGEPSTPRDARTRIDVDVEADATVLALGGASWPQLGSDGRWVPVLAARGVDVAPLAPANCGFDVRWSPHFAERHAGDPVKHVVARTGAHAQQGEFVVTTSGVEGQLIYALSAFLRDELAARGTATLMLDLMPDFTPERIARELAAPRGSRSRSEHWRRRLKLDGVKAALVIEHFHASSKLAALDDSTAVANAVKALPLTLVATRPIDEAISSAGGVRFESLAEHGSLTAAPGVFVAGEMVDWEAPTGGYLLTACFASGLHAGRAAAAHAERAVAR